MELACHLILADGCGINHISRSALLNRFVEQLITVCNYSAGCCSGLSSGKLLTVYLDIQTELKKYCFTRPEYIVICEFSAVSFNTDYTEATFFIDTKLFTYSNQALINIALSMIATVNYVMVVFSGHRSPAHCALIEINGKGALICAPGGTGKSTCAARLPVPHRVLAEDCALLIQSGNDFIAHAMPAWSLVTSDIKKVHGVRFDCSASIKLAGIFFLEQSSTDAVLSLDKPIAQGYLNSSFNDQMRWFLIHLAADAARQLRMKMFNLAEQVSTELPAYRLCAALDGEFWNAMDEVLR
jgi:SynChlorMet cassette protein ScmC